MTDIGVMGLRMLPLCRNAIPRLLYDHGGYFHHCLPKLPLILPCKYESIAKWCPVLPRTQYFQVIIFNAINAERLSQANYHKIPNYSPGIARTFITPALFP
jgi:hypothetical protein